MLSVARPFYGWLCSILEVFKTLCFTTVIVKYFQLIYMRDLTPVFVLNATLAMECFYLLLLGLSTDNENMNRISKTPSRAVEKIRLEEWVLEGKN